MSSFSISTIEEYQLIDIGIKVKEIFSARKVENGSVSVSVSHTTAAILIIKDESRVLQDWLVFFKEGKDPNTTSSSLGREKILPVQNGKIILGDREHIFLAELNGPQRREVTVEVC